MDIFGVAINALKPTFDDDFVDRVNYFYSSTVLLLFAVIVSTRQWIGQPIECWVPAEFKSAWEEYTENYCYIQDTYWLPMNHSLPVDRLTVENKRISYYQWVPFILGTQAMMFYVPFAFWRIFTFRSGFNIDTIVSVARECALTRNEQEEEARVTILAAFVKDALRIRQSMRSNGCSNGLQYRANFLTIVYTIVKCLYVVNACLQLVLMEKLLSTGSRLDGTLFPTLLSGIEWYNSGSFPRVTLCNFEVRLLGNVNRYTVQCVLMINMFIEKIYMVVWCWVVALLLFNAYHVARWLLNVTMGTQSNDHVDRLLYIRKLRNDEEHCEISVQAFVKNYLRQDGTLLIMKVAYHAGDVIASHLVHRLYKSYSYNNEWVCLEKVSSQDGYVSQNDKVTQV